MAKKAKEVQMASHSANDPKEAQIQSLEQQLLKSQKELSEAKQNYAQKTQELESAKTEISDLSSQLSGA